MMDALLNNIVWFLGNSLFIIGLWTVCKEGMLLGFFIHKKPKIPVVNIQGEIVGYETDEEGKSFHETLPEWIHKPLYSCPPCMASVWGLTGFMLSDWDVIWLIPYMVMLSGLNAIIVNYINFD